jgi:hypothetical protein
MALSARSTTNLGLPALLVLLAAPGCVDIVGADLGRAKYVERDEKHFPVTGKPEVVLGTFDGSIEIRPWDKPDVQVVVEKRGRDKDDVAAIVVQATQNGNRVEVSVTEPKNSGGFNIHSTATARRLVVQCRAPRTCPPEGLSIDIEHDQPPLQLRSGGGASQAILAGEA